ncbi:uncharacterized protein N7446_001750 [Penicillium canescens]|uniref:Uncharacterized protein n=1 Tax=Penicillium canescens TaxID=5083 RepID=A0AAD6ICX9_PENCN|nr:uncharacterized protein N7446_001750 [Penicillium canescens]KAJ6043552.1 hypothetical protein N7460_004907 [Penicillium canescens]KAJ6055026.1 hypothetical protein N7444_004124 [Penicillium canescens]KAJ6073973.1 hypothetical protein N7446_001750 [Penicillium canescens]
MLWRYLITMAIQLCWINLGVSELTIPIPWVGDGPDYFQGYGANALGSHGDATSYAINCLATETTCEPFSPDLTVIAGPSTYDMIGSGFAFDIKSGCTFTGDPTPTLATCVQTISYHNTPLVTTSSITVTGTGNPSTGIYPAMLRMTDTGKPTTTNQPATTDQPTATETWSLPSIQDTASTEPLTAARTRTHISTATGIQIPPRPGNSTSYSNGTETVTVTLIVTEAPIAVTCKCDCECPTRSQADEHVISSTPPNNAIGKQVALSLMGAILAVVVFCM